jgi:hypothetical protein
MPARSLIVVLAAAMLTACAVPDIYSIPDRVRGMAPGKQGTAADAAPVLFVVDGESGPNSCEFQQFFIYQPGVPVHRVSFDTVERHNGRVVSSGGGEIELPLDPDRLSFHQTADGPAHGWMPRDHAVSCEQLEFQIDIACASGPCPPYRAGERSDRGDRIPINTVLTTSF